MRFVLKPSRRSGNCALFTARAMLYGLDTRSALCSIRRQVYGGLRYENTRPFSARTHRWRILAALASLALALPAQATFHFMQIEQVIGGVNGDTTAQAVQLRMRFAGQTEVNGAELVAVDAAGNNPITLATFPTDVTDGNPGSRILITTSSFAAYEATPISSDFTMDAIPASYLAAGRLAFQKFGIRWSVSWGGLYRAEHRHDSTMTPTETSALPLRGHCLPLRLPRCASTARPAPKAQTTRQITRSPRARRLSPTTTAIPLW